MEISLEKTPFRRYNFLTTSSVIYFSQNYIKTSGENATAEQTKVSATRPAQIPTISSQYTYVTYIGGEKVSQRYNYIRTTDGRFFRL